MLKIIICDTDPNACEELRQLINCVMFEKIDISIRCYEDSTELVKLLDAKQLDAELIFLNTDMPSLDGFSTAHILRKNNINTDIIFVSSSCKCVLQGYEVHAYDFLVKPISSKKMEQVLLRYYQECILNEKKYLLINRRTKKELLPINNIRYFASDKRKIKAVSREPYKVAEFYMKMDELETKMEPKGFCRCHQSYLVNVHHILNWDGNNITLLNNEKIPVSRKYRENILSLIEKISI